MLLFIRVFEQYEQEIINNKTIYRKKEIYVKSEMRIHTILKNL